MFIAVSKHTTAGAKRFYEDRGIDLGRSRREAVAESFRRHDEARQRRKKIEAEERRKAWECEQARAARLAEALANETPPARAVIAEVAKRHGLTASDIVSASRKRVVVEARFDAIAEVFHRCRIDGREYTLNELGRVFRRDHTSCLHALRQRGLR